MEKLQNYTYVEKFFKNGISDNWKYSLDNGTTEVYDDCILSYFYIGMVLIINSGSIGNKKFNKSMLRRMRSLIVENNNVIISSSVDNIAHHMLFKYGFKYNKNGLYYIKGE